MDRNNIEKIAETSEDRVLLAKLWDKIQTGMRKNIPAHSGFLSPRELQLAQFLFGDTEGLYHFGGYSDAERKMLVYLPDYLEPDYLSGEESPVICLRAQFYRGESPNHRDFLGALMGCGITRECVGDILVAERSCDFLVTSGIAPFILQNFESAGRVSLKLSQIPLNALFCPIQNFTEVTDTVASVRLDSVIAAGFRISRAKACEYIAAGRAVLNGLICEKPDRVPGLNCKISVRGLGKIKLTAIGHITKKGRISVVIHRYE